MSKEEMNINDEHAFEEPVADNDAAQEPMQDHEQAESDDLYQELESLRRERDELKEKLLLSMADFQNYARRARQDVDVAREHRIRDMGRQLLPVLDHFDHALQVDPDKTTTQSLLAGVSIVRDELTKALATFEIRRMDVKPGDEFDPNRHEALMRQAVEGMPANRIAQELQPGYTHGDNTLRPAKVAVTE